MRILLAILLTFSLTLSGVVNAAMLCCLDIDDSTKVEQSDNMPCHQSAETDDASSTADAFDCQCDSCIHSMVLDSEQTVGQTTLSESHRPVDDRLIALYPDRTHYPPKHLS